MKFGPLKDYNKRKIVFKKTMEKMRKGDEFHTTFFKKTLYELKASGLQFSFNKF